MGVVAGRRDLGLFPNAQAQLGTNSSFSAYSYYAGDGVGGGGSCFAMTTNRYGDTLVTGDYIPVDTSKYYQMSVSVKTISRSYNNRLGSGHLGFSTYDQFYNFIDLRNCGGAGNTTLTRPLNPGDSYAYVASVSGWNTSTTYYYRHLMFNPATHPYYSTPWGYSRIGYGDYNICHANTWTWTGTDYQVAIQNTSNVNMTMPNIGYALPAGTPVYTGQAGGTYNYAFGSPDYPETWTTYVTPPFTGENRNSGYPFRHGTKYIRFLNLANYNYRTETAGASAYYLVDNILLVECKGSTAYESSLFSR